MIYIDTPMNGWSHMISDDIEELHDFATKIGIGRHYFENKKGKNRPHYDVRTKRFYKKCVDAGAIEVTRKELFLKLKKIQER